MNESERSAFAFLLRVTEVAVEGLTQSACFTCGAEPGVNIDCRGCEWVEQARAAIEEARKHT